MTKDLIPGEVLEELRGVMRRANNTRQKDVSIIDQLFAHLEREHITVSAVERLVGAPPRTLQPWKNQKSRPNVSKAEDVLSKLGLKIGLEPIPGYEIPKELSGVRTGNRPMPGRGRSPIRTTSPLIRKLMEIVDGFDVSLGEIARAGGIEPYSLYEWRAGVTTARLASVEKLAATLGYRTVLVRSNRRADT